MASLCFITVPITAAMAIIASMAIAKRIEDISSIVSPMMGRRVLIWIPVVLVMHGDLKNGATAQHTNKKGGPLTPPPSQLV